MKFTTLSEEEFRTFLEGHPNCSFFQTPEIAKMREKNGSVIHYVGVKKETIIAATMMVSHVKHFGKSTFYAPRGLLINYKNKELLTFFIKHLKLYIKKQGGYSFRMDPYVRLYKRDTYGEILPEESHKEPLAYLKELGFHEVINREQIKWMYVIDTKNKTEKEIWKNLKANTRNHINKAKKSGIRVEELHENELELFHKILLETSERKDFNTRPLSYFQDMYHLFHNKGEIKFLATRLNLEQYMDQIQREIEMLTEKRSSLSDTHQKERMDIDKKCSDLQKRLEKSKKFIEKSGSEITMSVSMFMTKQPEIICLFGGNLEEYLSFSSQYLMQWHMITYALEHGYERYNFYGIDEAFSKEKPDHGVYQFKKEFNGYIEELLGEFILPITPLYYLFNIIQKIKS